MSSDDEVTLGVPVFRGQDFAAETLRSIQAQTHRDLRVIISVDGPDPASEEACRPFLADSRFRLVVQPENLGWVRNISWLMDQVETPFWCYQQQDDLLDPRYLETLVEHARRAPEASVVYCDIETFGDLEATITQSSLTGTPFVRQMTQLVERHSAVAFRGLTRVEALRHTGGVRPNEADDFSLTPAGWRPPRASVSTTACRSRCTASATTPPACTAGGRRGARRGAREHGPSTAPTCSNRR